MGGMKHDQGKVRWDLMLWPELEQVVRVMEYGDAKYEPGNWKKVDGWRRRYFGAAMRHLLAWWRGEGIDPESGLSHLAHAIVSLMFIMHLDRPVGVMYIVPPRDERCEIRHDMGGTS